MDWKPRGSFASVADIVTQRSGLSEDDLLNPKATASTDIQNMQRAAERIKQAVKDGTHISIMGDYDVDGITSTSILHFLLRKLGTDATLRLPRRFSEGYGLNVNVIDEFKPGLLITVDNGIAANDAIIFAYICDANHFKKPFSRIRLASQTEKGFKEAFDNLIPSSKQQNVINAGRARSIYDWIIGTNGTTQMTLRYPGNGVLSIGRVQTAVLNMLVEREEAIRSFVPKISWNIRGTFKVGTEEYQGLHKGSGEYTKSDADSILAAIKGKSGTVTKLEKEKTKRDVPLLYSQTTLQIDASKYFGYTAKETLDAAQALYDEGYTTYPRTKSEYPKPKSPETSIEKTQTTICTDTNKKDFH